HCGLARGVSSAHDCNVLRVVKHRLHAGAGVMDSGRLEAFCALYIELSPAYASCGQDRASSKLCAAIQIQGVQIFRRNRRYDTLDDDGRHHLGAELEHLQNSPCSEIVSGETIWETDKVFDS